MVSKIKLYRARGTKFQADGVLRFRCEFNNRIVRQFGDPVACTHPFHEHKQTYLASGWSILVC